MKAYIFAIINLRMTGFLYDLQKVSLLKLMKKDLFKKILLFVSVF